MHRASLPIILSIANNIGADQAARISAQVFVVRMQVGLVFSRLGSCYMTSQLFFNGTHGQIANTGFHTKHVTDLKS